MSLEVRAGGNRRLDRVLAESYLDGLADLPLVDVRLLRDEADQEEVDLSYLRRLLQGRLDIVEAELGRRGGNGAEALVSDLPRILSESTPRQPAFGLGRHSAKEPSRAGEDRRYVESLLADADLADVSVRTDAELHSTVEAMRAEEQTVSERRRQVQAVFDACSAEITRRYRDGEADPADLLPS